MRRTLIIVGSTVFVAGSMAVITAQHLAPAATHHPIQMLQSMCDEPGASGGTQTAHVPEHFVKMLDLSGAQLRDIERIAADACAVMRKTHESILQVLTPEQRAKVRELHGGDQSEGLASFLKKLHGGD